MCKRIFVAALFVVAKNGKWRGMSVPNRGAAGQAVVHERAYGSATAASLRKGEQAGFGKTWEDLRHLLLSEVSRSSTPSTQQHWAMADLALSSQQMR